MPLDTTYLVQQVQASANIPDNQATFSDQNLLDFAHRQLMAVVYPMMIKQREEWFARYRDYPVLLTTDNYEIANRAHMGVLRELKYITQAGKILDMTRIDLQDVEDVKYGQPTSFYLVGSSIYPYPTPNNTAEFIRQYYFERPSKLVPVAECGRITGVSGTTVTGSFPATWNTTNLFDIIKNTSDHRLYNERLSATAVSPTSITFTGTFSVPPTVGSYVALEAQTCLVQVPDDVLPLVIQLTVSKVAESLKQLDALAASNTEVGNLISAMQPVLGQRVQGAPKRITSPLI